MPGGSHGIEWDEPIYLRSEGNLYGSFSRNWWYAKSLEALSEVINTNNPPYAKI